ncbi:M1 family metallopeptidase [Streptomyces sp. HSG2]|uniref:M1 family metallopeptidase n=1 Tax=Streptomyces sp. HSG2 TaxID=2797167 RepID=UPI001904357D|nr:M1 family metallopeptidase [Streptomyces sp. HSG2]
MPHTPHPRRPRRRTAVALLAAAVSVSCLAAFAAPPTPLGVGDRLFPHLGNPGYDVIAYDLSFTYSGDNRAPLEALTRIDARVTTDLRRINLDFARGRVTSVRVGGEPAAFVGAGEDLVVTPRKGVTAGQRIRITVRHTSEPHHATSRPGGWVRTSDGLVMANQADAAHLVFPCNDHPSDKAMFTVKVTTPRGHTAVAAGLPVGVGEGPDPDTTTWRYRTLHPMATELAQVSIGRSAVLRRAGPRGLRVRDVVPVGDEETMEPWLARTPDHIAWMEDRLGPYPLEAYGVLVADATTGFALETQTLSLVERRLFTEPALPSWYVESIMVHELAHQWFGNSVTPRTWSDLWLSEGHATWYEALHAQDVADRSLVARMKTAYAASDRWRAAGGPPGEPEPPRPSDRNGIFRPNVYDGAALVLYALRQEIGPAAFARVQRAWVSRHRDSTAGTADFVDLASRIAGRDLAVFLHAWLYDEKTPPMPGHPDWRSRVPAAPDGPTDG